VSAPTRSVHCPSAANRKTREGAHHSNRDAQFEHIDACARRIAQEATPVISVDIKK